MVLDVCRSVLGNEQDAEDAFQATFLILAQKAGTIRKKASVGSWLYGVAYRTARQARLRSARRQRHESACPRRNAAFPPDDPSWREVQQLLHAELSRLPERYRAPLVHCYLEGKSQEDTARLLGVSRSTLQRRVDSGRALLQTRLVRQGLGPVVVLAAAAWPSVTASALVPFVLQDSTVNAAALIGAGEVVKSVISPRVVALMEGVLKAMFLTKLKVISAVVLTVLVGTGLAGWSYRAMAQTGPYGPRFQPLEHGQQETPSREHRSARPARRTQGAADELDALRLEIDALRKEVRADRERIKALEEEVHARVETPANGYPNQPGAQKRAGTVLQPQVDQARNQALPSLTNLSQNQALQTYPLDQKRNPSAPDIVVTPARLANDLPSDPRESNRAPSQPRERRYDAFAEAEAALKKLRQDPGDKGAAGRLLRATQRLKARAEGGEKPGGAANNSPGKGF
jgi:RNA polymerase sigma factor (sigma-70 family)